MLHCIKQYISHHRFCRTNNLLEEFCEATNSTYFYGCLWDCVLANPTIRLSAINFVLAHFNRKQTMEDQLYIMGTNIDNTVSSPFISLSSFSPFISFYVIGYRGLHDASRLYKIRSRSALSTLSGVTAPFRRVARWFIQQTLVLDSVFEIAFGCFSRIKNC